MLMPKAVAEVERRSAPAHGAFLEDQSGESVGRTFFETFEDFVFQDLVLFVEFIGGSVNAPPCASIQVVFLTSLFLPQPFHELLCVGDGFSRRHLIKTFANNKSSLCGRMIVV